MGWNNFMSKKALLILLFMMLSLSFLTECSKDSQTKSTNQDKTSEETEDATSLSNLDWINTKMNGDADGPAYVLYSKTGYNQATVNIALKDVKSNLVRKSDGKEVASYLFLGVDVYHNKEWVNCADAGIGKTGYGEWHAFVNRYLSYTDETWWESSINLNSKHDYQILLKTSDQDEETTLNIIDITDGNKVVDSKTFDLMYSMKDGSNTRYYRDLAIDFPEEVCNDEQGEPTSDWVEVVKYNTNEDLYVKNVHCYDVQLYNSEGSYQWTDLYEDYRFLWPDSTAELSYACTKVSSIKRDYEDVLNLDMNTAEE